MATKRESKGDRKARAERARADVRDQSEQEEQRALALAKRIEDGEDESYDVPATKARRKQLKGQVTRRPLTGAPRRKKLPVKRVVATRMGYYNDRLRYAGDEFNMEIDPELIPPTWVEELVSSDEDDPELTAEERGERRPGDTRIPDETI